MPGYLRKCKSGRAMFNSNLHFHIRVYGLRLEDCAQKSDKFYVLTDEITVMIVNILITLP